MLDMLLSLVMKKRILQKKIKNTGENTQAKLIQT
jgi:hypothetical protein